jgi:hypothetical protein
MLIGEGKAQAHGYAPFVSAGDARSGSVPDGRLFFIEKNILVKKYNSERSLMRQSSDRKGFCS